MRKNFCQKCAKLVRVTVAGACTICGVVMATPASAVQPHNADASSGATIAPAFTFHAPALGDQALFFSSHPLGDSGDPAEPPHPAEPTLTLDGPSWAYAGTAPTTGQLRALNSPGSAPTQE